MNANGTPLPNLSLNPGPPVTSQFQPQITNSDSTGYAPNVTPVPGTPAVQQMLPPPPPPPQSGRSAPYPTGRVPVTPPAIAGGGNPAVQVPVGDETESDDFMDIGDSEPDNPLAITELVAHLTSSSGATLRQVDVIQINMQRQQLDVTTEEQYANRLHLEYNLAIHDSMLWRLTCHFNKYRISSMLKHKHD
eukprot:2492334-Amphidinium_carterae.1